MKGAVTALVMAMVALVVVPTTAAARPGAAAPPAATTAPAAPARTAGGAHPVPARTAGGAHPVPASFVDGLRAEVRNPLGEHPATNDWDCQLTEAGPRPVGCEFVPPITPLHSSTVADGAAGRPTAGRGLADPGSASPGSASKEPARVAPITLPLWPALAEWTNPAAQPLRN